MHGHNGPPIGSRPPQVEWSRDWVGSHFAFNSRLNLLSHTSKTAEIIVLGHIVIERRTGCPLQTHVT